MKKLLTKQNSSMLHGIAILMMIYHHLFINGNTWYKRAGKSFFDILDPLNFGRAGSAQLTFAWFCKICVAVFAFTSGYAIYVQLDKKCKEKISFKEMYLYCGRRLWNFYKKFFLCFMFFMTYAYFTGNPHNFDYSLGNYVLNLLGIRATYNGTWWYILVYYCMILISPIAYYLLRKMELKHYLFCALAFVLSLGIALVSGNLIVYLKAVSAFIQNYIVMYVIIFLEGMFCGRYPLLEIISSRLNVLTSLILLILTFVARVLLIRAPSDSLFDLVLIVPFIVSSTRLVNCSKQLTGILSYVGKYSSYMWYSHAYFYSYLFFSLVARSDLSILVYLQVALYSLAAAIVFDAVERYLDRIVRKIKT